MHHHYYTFNNSTSVSATPHPHPHPHLINVRSHLYSDNFPNSNLVSTLNSKKNPQFSTHFSFQFHTQIPPHHPLLLQFQFQFQFQFQNTWHHHTFQYSSHLHCPIALNLPIP
ncbi:hypothetical protein Hanom_Chr11g00976581 [Helianthus anomalus]